MASKTKEYLKGRFENGTFPTEDDFADVIDSAVNKQEEVDQVVPDAPAAGHVPSTQAVKGYVAGEVAKLPSMEDVRMLAGKVDELDDVVNGGVREVETDVTEQVFATIATGFMGNEWNYGAAYASGKYAIPQGVKRMAVKANKNKAATVSFMKVVLPSGSWPNASVVANAALVMNGASRINIQPGEERVFDLNGDEIYLYVKKKSSESGWEPESITITELSDSGSGIVDGLARLEESVEYVNENVGELANAVGSIKNGVVGLEDVITVAVSDKVDVLDIEEADMVRGYVNANGVLSTASTSARNFTLRVSAGAIISSKWYYKFDRDPLSDSTRLVCAVCAKSNGQVVAAAGLNWNAAAEVYTVPEGIDEIDMSVASSGGAYYIHRRITITTPNGNVEKYRRVDRDGMPFCYRGNLASGIRVDLPCVQVRVNALVSFFSQIESFKQIVIGRKVEGNDSINAPYIVIDGTNISIHTNVSETFNSNYQHGLAIANDLQVIIRTGMNEGKLILRSNGGEYVVTNDSALTNLGDVYDGFSVRATAADGYSGDFAMTAASFSFMPLDANFDTWVFGDSWVSPYTNRWSRQIREMGFDKWLLVGYAGCTSANAIKSFRALIAMRKPKRVLWLLGMNDPDPSDESCNQSWKDCFDEVVETCGHYGIDLILATIPNVPSDADGGRRYMTAKNAIVRESGHRFVDQEAALGADNNGVWASASYYESETNKVHTSVAGAKVLAARFLADVPELAYN